MEQPDICFIQETKCNMDRMEIISKKYWNKYKFLTIESQNTAGGILTLWNPQSVNLLSVEATRHTLSVKMQVIGNTEEVLCTNVYGPQVLEDKRRMLLDLENLKERNSNIHWILAGDFNIITTLAEKKGGNQRLDRDAEEFTTFIEKMKLVDIRTSNGTVYLEQQKTFTPPGGHEARQIPSLGIHHSAGFSTGRQHPPLGGIRPLASAIGGKFSDNTKEQAFQIREILDRPPNLQGEHQSLVARGYPGTRDKDV
jgi:hypothetical protein